MSIAKIANSEKMKIKKNFILLMNFLFHLPSFYTMQDHKLLKSHFLQGSLPSWSMYSYSDSPITL